MLTWLRMCVSGEVLNTFSSLDHIGIDARKRELLEARFFDRVRRFVLTGIDSTDFLFLAESLLFVGDIEHHCED